MQPLNEQADLALGQLYFAMGDQYWAKCRTQMQKTIGRFPKSAAARESYIRMLLSRGDQRYYQEATAQFNRLRELAPTGRGTFVLSVQLGNKLGKQQEVRAELLRLLPNIKDATKLTDQQAEMLAFLAGLFVELDDLDNAERIYRQLAERDPKLQFALATFLGLHRDVGNCFELLAQLHSPKHVNDVLAVGINTLRARRDEAGDKYDATLEQWLNRALLENPDSITLLMLQADFNDVQKKYDESAAIYRKLLTCSDLEESAEPLS